MSVVWDLSGEINSYPSRPEGRGGYEGPGYLFYSFFLLRKKERKKERKKKEKKKKERNTETNKQR